MKQDGQGRGKLVPTGYTEPAVDVSYDVSHEILEKPGPNGMSVKSRKAVVHSIEADGGQKLPIGDFDLLVANELVRLKHIGGDPEWLVLSS